MEPKAGDTRALLFDMTRCSGCRECMVACNKKHGRPHDEETIMKIDDLSATSYSVIKTVGEDEHFRYMCRHCVTPSCASVCPVKALHVTELGPVAYDASKCMGCRYCMVACPFNVPRYEWDEVVPAVQKCDMCIDRQREGKEPACVEACPNEATVVGWRSELIKEAHARIAEDPEDYYDHLYGELEVGGTNVLFLTPRPVEELGFTSILGNNPVPDHTAEALKRIPKVAATVGAAMLGIWWITGRRDEVRAHEAREKARRAKPGKAGAR